MHPQSQWTVDTLKEHFDAVLNGRDEAVAKAEENAEIWRKNANEWRGAMTDREKNFITRNEFDAWKTSMRTALFSVIATVLSVAAIAIGAMARK